MAQDRQVLLLEHFAQTVKNCHEFLGFEVPSVLYGPNVSISLNQNLQSSLSLISLLAARPNRTTDI